MNKKIGVFGGDLFWSNLPYDLLNFHYETKVKNNDKQVDLIMFEDDIRINKVFSNKEKYYFDSNLYKNCKDLIVVKNWDDFCNVTKQYEVVYSSCKLAPKTRKPKLKGRINSKMHVWDTGGVDILVDSLYFASEWTVKGSIWKDFLKNTKAFIDEGNDENKIFVGSCPLYERYFKEKKFGKLISREDFYKKYNLDKSKRNLIICPTNPGCHQEMFNENLKVLHRVMRTFKNNDYNIVLKTYPHDYIFFENENYYSGIYKRKNFLNGSKPQYDYLLSLDVFKDNDVRLIESQDHHEAILYSDTMYNMAGSSVSWETFFSDCKSFSIGYEKAPFFKTLSYLPGCYFPDEYFNLNFENNKYLEYNLEKLINKQFVNFKKDKKEVDKFFL